jgi:hypothetical protein
MLTADDDNPRDALATSVAIVCLVSELLMHRRPGGDMCLSPQAADGLADVLQLVRTALFDAKRQLADAASDKARS